MIISLIAAMGKNHVIGKDNQMMWHLPKEYKYFKDTTIGHCIVMGRKNLQAQNRALPGRTNIVVTRQKGFQFKDCIIVNSLEEAINIAKDKKESELFIIGGGEIYEQSIPLADRIYLTVVDYNEDGDVYFPNFDQEKFNKKLIKHQEVSDDNKLEWRAYLYERKS